MNDISLVLASLRDFFLSPDAGALEKAAGRLADLGRIPFPELDWREVEYDFNRLFVGPAPPAAPPYASVYLEDEPRLMAESTLKVRHIYQMAGRVSPWLGTVPDDHLGLELDFCITLREAARNSPEHELAGIYAYFLEEHLRIWIPEFIEKVTSQVSVAPPIEWAVRLLGDWLEYEEPWLLPAELSAAAGQTLN